MMSNISLTLSIFVVLLVILDLLARLSSKKGVFGRFKENPLTSVHYIGIIIILFFAIWPNLQEGSIGNISFKKNIENLETRVTNVEVSVEEFLDRQILEYFTLDDVKNFNYYETDEANHLEFELQEKPIKNSISLWFYDHLTNPTNYAINNNIIDLRFDKGLDWNYIERVGKLTENLVVVSYIKILDEKIID